MKNSFYFWGVLRPDGKLLPTTFSSSKIGATLKAGKLSRAQLGKRWKTVKKEEGYSIVRIVCAVIHKDSM